MTGTWSRFARATFEGELHFLIGALFILNHCRQDRTPQQIEEFLLSSFSFYSAGAAQNPDPRKARLSFAPKRHPRPKIVPLVFGSLGLRVS